MSENSKTTNYILGPDSQVQDGVPKGALIQREWTSRIYPGTVRDYWVYVPEQYNAAEPACVMVFQDGWGYADPKGSVRTTVVLDNLIHKKEIPVIIGVFINPGRESEDFLNDPRDHFGKYEFSQRALEYDTVSDTYAWFLLEEILPEVGKDYNLRQDANGRGICGSSSGGLCAWVAAWEKPDAFSKVLSHVGSFTNIRGGHVCPYLIRRAERKPIRVFLQGGSNDMDCVWGDWALANQEMASALRFKGYDYRFEFGNGGHDLRHGGSIFPESLRWLWRE
ncbi:MAG: alpha/beta hydrolase-fold protein [Armatimonadota bacterium]|nr:esterase family protein [bacterium]